MIVLLFQLANLGTLTRESIRASGTKVSCTQNDIMNCVYLSLSLSPPLVQSQTIKEFRRTLSINIT